MTGVTAPPLHTRISEPKHEAAVTIKDATAKTTEVELPWHMCHALPIRQPQWGRIPDCRGSSQGLVKRYRAGPLGARDLAPAGRAGAARVPITLDGRGASRAASSGG